MRAYLTEAIGTFFLVFTICLTVVQGTPFAPLAIGAALMIMVYMGGHISGGHYNPAVTLAAVLRGALPSNRLGGYWVCQLLGSVLAAYVACLVTGQKFAPAPGTGVTSRSALAVEFLFTFALCLVVLNVATSQKTEGNSYYGLAIGFTIVVAAFAGGGLSGGAFNPAVGTGPTIIAALSGGPGWGNLWLYWVGPLLGGVVAAMVFRFQEGE
ncbi:MAG TPA: aquaporin [Gemmatimonadales bacterium]|nr:aquaporin [Gemmatimonadales bacterium]